MKKIKFISFLLVLVALCSYISVRASENKVLLHFVQISDTHLQRDYAKDGERLLGSSEKLLNDSVTQINGIKDLDFTLATGDLVDIPDEKLLDKFITITMSLNSPLYVLLGNHDVSVNGGLGKKGFIKKFTDVEGQMSFPEGMNYYSFIPNEKFKIVCLDGTTDKVVTARGQLSDKQLEWLKGQLEESLQANQFVIIALHFPAVEPFKSSTHNILEPDNTKFLALVNSYKNVIGVFSGHYHAAKIQKIANKIHNSCPAAVQYPNAFREIIITQDNPKYLNVKFEWHDIDGIELRTLSKNNSKSPALTEGNEEDRRQVVKFKIY
jgi:3',5'-cyclic AMP phosphodiesterase CpdA